jgi:hypothetical protein
LSGVHRCLGDYLWLAGYHLKSYLTGEFIGKFKRSMQMHKWIVQDKVEHNITRDWDMVTYLINKVIPDLKDRPEPFVIHWANWDSHPFPNFIIDERCTNRLPESCAAIRSCDCLDQIIERLFDGLMNSWAWNTTDVLLYGDHPVMVSNPALERQKGKLFLSVPTRERQVIVKAMTIYDIAPTILDLLGIDYSPKFVLGKSVFEEKASHILSRDEHEEIYSFFEKMNWERRFKRRGRRQLFRGLYRLKKGQEGHPDADFTMRNANGELLPAGIVEPKSGAK